MVLLTVGSVSAEMPKTMSYQGILKDQEGQPIENGNYEFTFKIYNVHEGGTALWTGTQTADVIDGVFHVILGQYYPLDLPFDETYWLGIRTGAEAEFMPRTMLASAPYAMRALVAETGDDGDWTVAGNDIYRLIGNIGIGTSSPDAKVEIDTGGSLIELGGGGGDATAIRGLHYPSQSTGYIAGPNTGVFGQGDRGVWGATADGYGIFGEATGTGYAGYFEGKIRTSAFQLPTGASSGYVLTSDDSGNGTWLPAGSASGAGWTVDGDDVYSSVPGNVGIGTDTPESKLHVSENYTGLNFPIKLANTSSFALPSIGTGILFKVNGAATEVGKGAIVYQRSNSYNRGDFHILQDSNADNTIVDMNDAVVTVRNNGNVGVGTTVPGAKLAVAGLARIEGVAWPLTGKGFELGYNPQINMGYAQVYDRDAGAWGDLYLGSGNVGIGTVYPAHRLDIRGSAYAENLDSETVASLTTSLDGVWGFSPGTVNGSGVFGESYSSEAPAVYALQSFDFPYDDWAYLAGHNMAIYGNGNGEVSGWFRATAIWAEVKNFLIDHPLDPEKKLLRHTSVESPEALLIYRGKVQIEASGEASVEMPDYFPALALEEEATIHTTAVGRPFLSGAEWNPGHASFVVYGEPGREVSWQVLADRDDPTIHLRQAPVEIEKGVGEFGKLCDRGFYLTPEAYGQPRERSTHYKWELEAAEKAAASRALRVTSGQ